MTPVEKLHAAIAKLEHERDMAQSGPWVRTGFRLWSRPNTARDNIATDFNWLYDVDLIVTLHRTIDAQLEILSTTLSILQAMYSDGFKDNTDWCEGELALADAILEGDQ